MADWGKILSRGNVEDRRSMAPVVGGLSLTGVALVLLFNFLTGGDLGDVLGQLDALPIQQQPAPNAPEYEGLDAYEAFASTVLGSNNDMWREVFAGINREYGEPRLVLFRTGTTSACGTATSTVGPHYCYLDETIYLDETFFDELTNRFGASGGDVAQAYVIAHEVAHHAQYKLGLLETQTTSSADSIAVELQADCFAGLWANSIRDLDVLSPGEIDEAMDAAAAVGDDRIQERVTGYVNPESWTHGSSEERVTAFTQGYNSGELTACVR